MRAFLLILGVLLFFKGSAQDKHDYNWVLGYGPSDSILHYGGTLIDFNTNTPILSFFDISLGLDWDNASISDGKGNKIALSNGCEIQNKLYEQMDNGDNINEGPLHEQYCESVVSAYLNDQGALFLPIPSSDSLYALFHIRWWPGGSIVKDLLYSIIDASANEGLGKVTTKNQPLQTDTFTPMVTACRHANGRDWWILLEENHRFVTLPPDGKAKYHVYLFDPYGVHYEGEQQIGRLSSYQSWVGQACFSPDGTRYASGNIHNGVNFFDFDRCTGMLSNPGHLDLMADSVVAMGIAFSPNSRYLYVTTGLWILQYDMEAADVAASKVNVAQYDGFESQLPTTFFQLDLAPNGKIYGSSHFGTDVLHIIHQPDQPGLACEVEQHGLKLPVYHAFTMPNVPHYRLYDVPGSVCDSLGIDGPMVAVKEPKSVRAPKMVLFPNPAFDLLTVYLEPEASGRITLMDVAGKTWAEQVKTAGLEQVLLKTAEVPSGVYFISFCADTGTRTTQKVIIQH